MNETHYDYWSNATEDDWRRHVAETVDSLSDLARDGDRTFFMALRALSDVYRRLHGERGGEEFDANDQRSTEDYFWGLQRASTVIDAVVGSGCVVLMRWMEWVKRASITALVLVETPFPIPRWPATEKEWKKKEKEEWERHHGPLMQNYGALVPGKRITGAEAVWQIGNCFKHSYGGELREPARNAAMELGFASPFMTMPRSDGEQRLRDAALQTVGYTLGADSIERVLLQLGCGPEKGLMPLYELIESWQQAIGAALASKVAAFRRQP